MISQRDLLLVPFPFSDQKGTKVRPVVALSNEDFNCNSEDVIVAAVTSNVTKGKYALELFSCDLEEGILNHDCCIKVENILRLDKKLILKKIGRIKQEKYDKVTKLILEIIN